MCKKMSPASRHVAVVLCGLAALGAGWSGGAAHTISRRQSRPNVHASSTRDHLQRSTGLNGGGGDDALRQFLGADSDSSPRVLDSKYEDGLVENLAEHARECNADPWGGFKRLVPIKERDACIPNKWTRPAEPLELRALDPEREVAVSESMLLFREECDAVIAEAEASAQWTKSFPHASKEREALLPERVKVDHLPAALAWLGPTLARRICPAIEAAFRECPAAKVHQLRLYQATVLRYDADSTAGCHLPVHQDFSFITVTVPLNDPAEYDGGGTWIHVLQRAVRPPLGHALAHSGRVWHGGHPVTRGRRYALALFFHSARLVNHGLRFEQRATRLIAQGKTLDACKELTYSVRAYEEAALAQRADRDRAQIVAELVAAAPQGRSLADYVIAAPQGTLYGLLANLHQQLGNFEESARILPRLLVHVSQLQLHSQEVGSDHPALAGVLHNLRMLQRRNTIDGEQARGF